VPYPCSLGHYCDGEVRAPCQAGRRGDTPGLTTAACGGACPLGFYCGEGAVAPLPCPPASVGNQTGLTSEHECSVCPHGFFCSGGAHITPCTLGHYCPVGSDTPKPCAAGYRADTRGLTTPTCGGPCPLYSFCLPASTSPQLCADGTVGAHTNLTAQTECADCPGGHWCNSGRAFPCDKGTFSIGEPRNRTSLNACDMWRACDHRSRACRRVGTGLRLFSRVLRYRRCRVLRYRRCRLRSAQMHPLLPRHKLLAAQSHNAHTHPHAWILAPVRALHGCAILPGRAQQRLGLPRWWRPKSSVHSKPNGAVLPAMRHHERALLCACCVWCVSPMCALWRHSA